MTNHQVSVDDQCCEEQMTFPYLLNLDNETDLLGDEPSDETTPEKEPEEHPSETMAAGALSSTEEFTGTTQEIPIPKLTIANPTTTLATAYTPITTDVSTEVTHLNNETLSALRDQLANAQKEIADLRHRVDQSEVRHFENGIRMLKMEKTLWELTRLSPTIQNETLMGREPQPRVVPHIDPTEEDTEGKGANHKRTLGENFNNNPPQPPAKRTKTIKVNTTKPKREKVYAGKKPHCSKCNLHHQGPCSTPCDKCHLFGHRTKDCKLPTSGADSNTSKICFECGGTGHIRSGCPQLKMKSNNPNNPTGTSYNTNPNLIRYR